MTRLGCLSVAMGLLVLAGCAISDSAVHSSRWDGWIGTTKDSRVREMGIPLRCHTFKEGGELCEWNIMLDGGKTEIIGLQFDPKGVACQWSYRGFYGLESSKAKC
ncbi:MAG: hypothetical protein HY348_07210 [Nitrospira defluvii]|nr:hypothetical protein [Nitrospira defluvii]